MYDHKCSITNIKYYMKFYVNKFVNIETDLVYFKNTINTLRVVCIRLFKSIADFLYHLSPNKTHTNQPHNQKLTA